MRFRKFLHKLMYHDRADVYRGKQIRKGNLYDYSNETELIYKDIPCKLGFYRHLEHAQRTPQAMFVSEDYRVTCDPEYLFKENDIMVIQHVGQTFRTVVGNILNYPTHKEVSVRLKKEAGR